MTGRVLAVIGHAHDDGGVHDVGNPVGVDPGLRPVGSGVWDGSPAVYAIPGEAFDDSGGRAGANGALMHNADGNAHYSPERHECARGARILGRGG